MASNPSTATFDEDPNHGRGFRWVAVLAGLAVLGVAGATALALAFPAFTPPGWLAIAIAGTAAVTGLAIVATLTYLDSAFTTLDDHHAGIEQQRQAVTKVREEAWERHEELQEQNLDGRLASLEDQLDELEAEQASLAQQVRSTATPTPFGDIHEVATVEGVRAEDIERLEALGIEDTEQLWMGNAKVIADHLDRDAGTVRRWQHQAELMALPSVGGRSAQMLAQAGVGSVSELAGWGAEPLTARLRKRLEGLETEPEEELVSRARVEAWIDNARRHDPSAYRVHRHQEGYAASAPA